MAQPIEMRPQLLTSRAQLSNYWQWYRHLGYYPDGDVRTASVIQRLNDESLNPYVFGTGTKLDPAIFVIRVGAEIVSAGSVEIRSETNPSSPYLPARTPYARIDDSLTQIRYRNLGLNSRINTARVVWAREHDLPWVETDIQPTNVASILSTSNTGFIINGIVTTQDSIRLSTVAVVCPISLDIFEALGVRSTVSESDGESLRIEDLLNNPERFNIEYGIPIKGRYPHGDTALHVQMIPRHLE